MTINFAALTAAEQQEVAARLLRIAESGWKPFWCPDPTCDGMPHWAVDDEGLHTFVSENEREGPNGEPVGPVVVETPDGDWETVPEQGLGSLDLTHLVLGRPILDDNWAHNHARVDQRLPGWLKPWTLFIMSGRGSGKTTTGTEFVTLCARRGLTGAIVGRRGTELVNTHVATIIARAHPEFTPTHWASKDILEWPEVTMPDGSKVKPITYLFSAEKPENIRSVNLSYAWVDEAAFMDEIETVWMNLQLATRIEVPNNPIHFLITSTPQPTEWTMKMEDDDDVTVRRVSTYANRANLSESFLETLRKQYEGTRMGRQELHGEVLRDVEGAMWNDDMFIHDDVPAGTFEDLCESFDDRVVAIDPAGSKSKRSDETGIIAVGAHHFDDSGLRLRSSLFGVLADASLKGTPTEWARRAFTVARLVKANRIVAEKNFGGDMVKQVLTDFATLHPDEARDEDGNEFRIHVLHAVKSKETRAESAVAKYEQGRVTHYTGPHAYGDLSKLEKEQTTWVPKSRGGKSPSPNRIDAEVWAINSADKSARSSTQAATAASVLSKMNRGSTARTVRRMTG